MKQESFAFEAKEVQDLWTILCRDSLPVKNLKEAIDRVFENRGTAIAYPMAFSADFASDPTNKRRWRAFLKGLGREEFELNHVIDQLGDRLAPYLTSYP